MGLTASKGSDISSSPSSARFESEVSAQMTFPTRMRGGASGGGGARRGGRSLTVFIAERSIDESGRWVEEDAKVKGRQVIGLDAVVLDGHVSVVIGSGVHVPAAMGSVQHMREACLLQPVAVQRSRPG